MRIPTGSIHPDTVNVMWDCGATLSLITFKVAKKLGLKGKKVNLSIVKVGAKYENIDSYEYQLPLLDKSGQVNYFNVYGIDQISSEVESINLTDIVHLFPGCRLEDIERPSGEIHVLIGFEYAGCHPMRCSSSGNLLLMKNQFGMCIGGAHPAVKENTKKLVQHVMYKMQQCKLYESYRQTPRKNKTIVRKWDVKTHYMYAHISYTSTKYFYAC